MNFKILRVVFQIPVWLFLVIAFGGSIYGYVSGVVGMFLVTPIILGVIISLYVVGRVFLKDDDRGSFQEEELTDDEGMIENDVSFSDEERGVPEVSVPEGGVVNAEIGVEPNFSSW